MKKCLAFLLILLLLPGSAALALSPTPVPTPLPETPTPVFTGTPPPPLPVTPTPPVITETPTPLPENLSSPRYRSMGNCISVYCYGEEGEVSVPLAFRCSNEGGIMADGYLMFGDLTTFLRYEYEAPTVTVSAEPLYQVFYDSGYIERLSENVSWYKASEDGFEYVPRKEDGQPVPLADLQPGDYLMEISISAGRGNEYYQGSCLVHLIIPGGVRTGWPIPTDQTTPLLTTIPPDL